MKAGRERRANRKFAGIVGRIFGFALVAVLVGGAFGVVFAQHGGTQSEQKAPVVERDERDDGIVRGTVVAVDASSIAVRDEDGVVRDMAVKPTTLVISDEKDFSIANMPEIQLEVTDLAKGDEVEVVIEPAKSELRAGIVTKMSPISTTARNR